MIFFNFLNFFKFLNRCFSTLTFLCYLHMVIAMILVSSKGYAASTYYNQHAIGWHWYNEPKEKKANREKRDDKKVIEAELEQEPSDPVAEMKAVKAKVEYALDKAILYPTTQNIGNYIKLQNEVSDRAERFSKVWQLVLLEQPGLNYALKHPTNNLARQVYSDVHYKKEEEAIKKLSKQSGLFYFYKSSCPYCQKFAPIVKNFSEQYGISIIPISLDGDPSPFLPEFPNSQIDKGQAAKLNVTVTPALFSVNPKTRKVIPIAYGLISQEDLRQRILDVATNFNEEVKPWSR
jgi:conjugal transfer pilus assembly protein TraF